MTTTEEKGQAQPSEIFLTKKDYHFWETSFSPGLLSRFSARFSEWTFKQTAEWYNSALLAGILRLTISLNRITYTLRVYLAAISNIPAGKRPWDGKDWFQIIPLD